MTPTLDRVTERVPVKEPAKAWKNRWLASRIMFSACMVCGHTRAFQAGDEYLSHCLQFTSADDARRSAEDTPHGIWQVYLGPIQVPA